MYRYVYCIIWANENENDCRNFCICEQYFSYLLVVVFSIRILLGGWEPPFDSMHKTYFIDIRLVYGEGKFDVVRCT